MGYFDSLPAMERLGILVNAIEIRARIDRRDRTIAAVESAGRAVMALANRATEAERERIRMAAYHEHAARHGCRKVLPSVCSPCYGAMLRERGAKLPWER